MERVDQNRVLGRGSTPVKEREKGDGPSTIEQCKLEMGKKIEGTRSSPLGERIVEERKA